MILAHARGTLVAPTGPLAGTSHSTMGAVIRETSEGWLVDAFHSTLLAPT